MLRYAYPRPLGGGWAGIAAEARSGLALRARPLRLWGGAGPRGQTQAPGDGANDSTTPERGLYSYPRMTWRLLGTAALRAVPTTRSVRPATCNSGFAPRHASELTRSRQPADAMPERVCMAFRFDSNTEPGDGPAAALDEKRERSTGSRFAWNAGASPSRLRGGGPRGGPTLLGGPPQGLPTRVL